MTCAKARLLVTIPMRVLGLAGVLLAVSACAPLISAGRANKPPNIVFILADDLGYGDVSVYNPHSRIATPHIDRLALQGMRFTDAHAAATCVPSRYQLLTGRYRFRAQRDFAREALIEPGRLTLAALLKRAGYDTAMIGKWHLGFEGLGGHPKALDAAVPLRGGPVDHGFDRYFGIHASLDVAPYIFIENDRVVEPPSATIEEHHTPGVRFVQGEFWRGGAIAPGFRHAQVLPELTERAVQYLESRAGARRPFFLYVALTAPHPPWLPLDRFRGRSGAGMYGDFVMQVDDVVNRIVSALEEAGQAKDTLLIFTSDNGPTWYEADVQRYGHRAAGPWRGMKADAWEGGHRVPFIVRWPGKIPAGATSDELISLTDMLATFASLTAQTLPQGAGEDSLDMLPVWLGNTSSPIRQALIHEALRPTGESLALSRGEWKLIPWRSEVSLFETFDERGRLTAARETPQAGAPAGQLYHLKSDPGERHDVYVEHPDVVRQLSELLERFRREGRSSE